MATAEKTKTVDKDVEEIREADLTIAVPKKKEKYKGPMVSVFLPELEAAAGMKVDQYEHVTIANDQKEDIWHVKRGENVMVPVPVYIVLKGKYPKI